MTASKFPDAQTAYLDFAQFNKLKQEYRTNSDAGIQATAKQLEGVFLNMMLKSMRQANSAFAEGNYLNSQDSEYYRDMYDQQLSLNLSARGGIGLADMIVRQMTQLEGRKAGDAATAETQRPEMKAFDMAGYRERAIPALLRPDLTESESLALAQSVENTTAEADVFAPASAQEPSRQISSAPWQTADEFVATILPHAQRAARQLNIDPMAIVAQAALETGWGQHVMQDQTGKPSFNLFGIKANASWQGDTVSKRTLEYRNGIAAPESAAFRSYSSLESAFDDYVKFLKGNPRYQNIFQLNSEAKQWGYALQNAGYATDPNYGNKIARLLESDILRAQQTATTTSL